MSAEPESGLDRRLLPTAGVLTLIGAALVDLVLLPFELALAVVYARRRRREIEELIQKSANAPQDPHPAR